MPLTPMLEYIARGLCGAYETRLLGGCYNERTLPWNGAEAWAARDTLAGGERSVLFARLARACAWNEIVAIFGKLCPGGED